jgi:hypothetical protein
MKAESMEAIKVAPSVGFMGAYAAGWSINEWAAAAALLYTCLLIAEWVWKKGMAWRAKRRHRE